MNREDVERFGHLFVKPDLVVSHKMMWKNHKRINDTCTFLGHLEGYGDMWWEKSSYSLDQSRQNGRMLLVNSSAEYDYYQITQPEARYETYDRDRDHSNSKKYVWYQTALKLARKKKLYLGKYR